MRSIHENRSFLKSDLWEDWQAWDTDQRKGLPHPPPEKPFPPDARLVDLTPPADLRLGDAPLLEVINRRRSRRKYTTAPLTLEELSFLLWTTQGVHEVHAGGLNTLRSVPSAGARHPLETYLAVSRVSSLPAGLYRYLPLEHKLHALYDDEAIGRKVAVGCRNQNFVAGAAVSFIWSAIPYRSEWRYKLVAPKLIALDAGHVCQNLYLAAEAIGAGVCAIAAYDQKKMDAILGVDGEDEFTIYVAPVGKIAE